jgi:hypothetical protein
LEYKGLLLYIPPLGGQVEEEEEEERKKKKKNKLRRLYSTFFNYSKPLIY